MMVNLLPQLCVFGYVAENCKPNMWRNTGKIGNKLSFIGLRLFKLGIHTEEEKTEREQFSFCQNLIKPHGKIRPRLWLWFNCTKYIFNPNYNLNIEIPCEIALIFSLHFFQQVWWKDLTDNSPFFRNLTVFLSFPKFSSSCRTTFLYLPQSHVVPKGIKQASPQPSVFY